VESKGRSAEVCATRRHGLLPTSTTTVHDRRRHASALTPVSRPLLCFRRTLSLPVCRPSRPLYDDGGLLVLLCRRDARSSTHIHRHIDRDARSAVEICSLRSRTCLVFGTRASRRPQHVQELPTGSRTEVASRLHSLSLAAVSTAHGTRWRVQKASVREHRFCSLRHPHLTPVQGAT
jgi:hypothetical protein